MDWSWKVVLDVLPSMAEGLVVTVQATIVGALLAYVLGLALALLKMSRFRIVSFTFYWISEFIRRTPLLVQLYFLFFVLPDFGMFMSPFMAGVVGLGLHFSTYTSEVYRAGIENVPKGQWEATRALNYSTYQTMRYAILPQAIPPMIPPLANYLITMFKETPLLAAIESAIRSTRVAEEEARGRERVGAARCREMRRTMEAMRLEMREMDTRVEVARSRVAWARRTRR